jgi:rhodanese-related sulfurtransferase
MSSGITPEAFKQIADSALVFDVRREADFAASSETVPGAFWKNHALIDDWIAAVPKTHEVVVYCVRGGAISQNVAARLIADGVRARYVEGGIEALKAAGAALARK